jgi:hypothetical protein
MWKIDPKDKHIRFLDLFSHYLTTASIEAFTTHVISSTHSTNDKNNSRQQVSTKISLLLGLKFQQQKEAQESVSWMNNLIK